MWAGGLISEDVRNRIKAIASINNEDLSLSRRFLDFPLHVSFKRSFYTNDFYRIREDLAKLINDNGIISGGKLRLCKVKDMIWFRFEKEDELRSLHDKIDTFLLERYDIAIDSFDASYVPHISLFRDEDEEKLKVMYERMLKERFEDEADITSFFIGGKNHDNEYYRITGEKR